MCHFVRELASADIDAACVEIFGDLNDLRAAKLKQAVQYYLNGTKDGFLKYRTASGKCRLYPELFLCYNENLQHFRLAYN